MSELIPYGITAARGALSAYRFAKRKREENMQGPRNTSSQGNVRTHSSKRKSKKKNVTLKRLTSIVLATRPQLVVRCDAINTEFSGKGKRNIYCAGLAADDRDLPIHAFELTAVPVMVYNPSTQTATYVEPDMLYIGKTKLTGTNTNFTWERIGSDDSKYTALEKGLISRSETSLNFGDNLKKVWIQGFDMSFQFYAAAKQPLRYTVQLVQFNKREIIPDYMRTNGALPNTADGQNFWGEQVKPLIAGPLSHLVKKGTSGMRVLMQKTIEVGEILSDTDYTKKHVLRFKYDVDKMYSLDWSNNLGPTPLSVQPLTHSAEVFHNAALTWQERIRPESRIYAIVKCESLRSVAGDSQATWDANYNGSYDYVIRAIYRNL